MKIKFENQEYLDVKLSPKGDAIIISSKVKWEENSFALSSVALSEEQLDQLITELIQLKTKVKNAKV
jgi:hypothetical protein